MKYSLFFLFFIPIQVFAIGKELPLAQSLLETYGVTYQNTIIKEGDYTQKAYYSCWGEIQLDKSFNDLPFIERVKTLVHEYLHAVDTRICYAKNPEGLEQFTDYLARRIVAERYGDYDYTYGYDIGEFKKYDTLSVPEVISLYKQFNG